ncbi:hypothetical protein PtB15_1B290 [Puccinia triticina]|nr:hypothetical protein PtB15_1B290 [Puccinia triticina]
MPGHTYDALPSPAIAVSNSINYSTPARSSAPQPTAGRTNGTGARRRRSSSVDEDGGSQTPTCYTINYFASQARHTSQWDQIDDTLEEHRGLTNHFLNHQGALQGQEPLLTNLDQDAVALPTPQETRARMAAAANPQ